MLPVSPVLRDKPGGCGRHFVLQRSVTILSYFRSVCGYNRLLFDIPQENEEKHQNNTHLGKAGALLAEPRAQGAQSSFPPRLYKVCMSKCAKEMHT